MKKILITGANSYIGSSFERYVKQWPNEYGVDVVDMMGGGWRKKDFGQYDAVFHVAGIAHSDIEGISEERKRVYYAVNTDLAIETGTKAKRDGVGQFVFMSSMVVFGDSAPIGKEKMITRETKPNPTNFYGDSKLKAEEGLLRLADERFKVVILRPPMIYVTVKPRRTSNTISGGPLHSL
ncbi:MAG: NAD-dependent epimerase/dehydratase family protein [Eubacteriales bacterium]|nr:NAD-dependent epimerase/dehydratase family protein [Eubacteriales bacterium]